MDLFDHGLMAVGRSLSVAALKKCPDELRQRAVRLYRESDPKPVIRRLAEQLGVHHEALRNWIAKPRPTRVSVTTGRPARWSRRTAGCAGKSPSCGGRMRS
ncbi:transposase [Micromonospora sp. KC721]|uniref:transposase n=1 Tax=Micromonospora sp. KC721 TaxID=2530380 RepID=UPI001048B107|nr:hypothetical protein E1182_08740 [Micromonospora sp. KC721]